MQVAKKAEEKDSWQSQKTMPRPACFDLLIVFFLDWILEHVHFIALLHLDSLLSTKARVLKEKEK